MLLVIVIRIGISISLNFSPTIFPYSRDPPGLGFRVQGVTGLGLLKVGESLISSYVAPIRTPVVESITLSPCCRDPRRGLPKFHEAPSEL